MQQRITSLNRNSIRRLTILLLAALLIAATLWWLLVREQPEELGPQQQVQTNFPKAGVHTRLTDEVETAKIKRSLAMVREMGAPWIVEYFPWAYVQPRPDVYKWTHTDQVIQHADRQGLTVIARLGFVPEWARPPETTPLYLDDEYFDEFGVYAAQFAARYAGIVDHVILWNEPNLALEWGYAEVDPAKYVRMLKVVYPMIKAANPDVQVLAGALAPTLAPVGSEWGMNDLDYLEAMYAAGAADYFDILAIHAYGWSFPPDEPAAADTINFRRSELQRAIMERNGDGDKAAMITEGGWNDHPRWTRAVRPGQRIAYTLRAYDIAESEWPWLTSIALWAFRYPWDAKSYQDNYTFVRTDFEPKPIYAELARHLREDMPE